MSNQRNLTEYEIESIISFIKPQMGIPLETAMSVVKINKNHLRQQLLIKKIYPEMIPMLKDTLEKQYESSMIQAGESVGVIGAQSIGERQTQSTLNSVDWTDKILYVKNGESFVEPIGQMIDKILHINKKDIQFFQKNNTEYLDLPEGYYIPSGDEDGFNEWLRIEAVTRHLPSGKLVKVTTQSGRKVMASQCKSFLVWNGTRFVSTLGSDVKVGDVLPTTKNMPRFKETKDYFDTTSLFSKNKYLVSHIPDKIRLDNDFGFFIGLYLAEGWATDTFVCIRNNDKNIRDRVIDCLDSLGIIYNITSKGKKFLNGELNDLKIKSTFLARMFKIICETGSEKKFVPEFAYTAPNHFITGLIDGYFSGNGIVNKRDGYIMASSLSERLLHGISFLLSYFGIFGIFGGIREKQNITGRKSIKYSHTLSIRNGFFRKFAMKIQLTDVGKQKKLQLVILNKEYKYIYGKSQEEYPQERDVYFDKIISVEYVKATTGLVYDFTVTKTRNFNLFNGLNCRDTFHKAGSGEKSATTGVPRVEEMLNATRDPKNINCVVYTKDNHKTISELRKTIGHSVVEMTFAKITKHCEIVMNKKPEEWYRAFEIIYGDSYKQFTDCISLQLDMDIMYEYKLDMEMIKDIVSQEYSDMVCVFSPDNIGKMDVFVDTSNIDLPENRLCFIDSENAREIYLEEVVQPILYKIIICGVPGIENIYFNDNPNSFETEGSNYKKLLGLSFVDDTRTFSNNVWDIYETLGVEATRQFLIDEFMQVCAGINRCHIQLLVEKMTYNGAISSISRYTMRNEECGPMGKASFEETMDNFLKAGAYGQKEETCGVSASIICGKRANIGTGVCELRMDVKALPNCVRVLHDVKETMNMSEFSSSIVTTPKGLSKNAEDRLNKKLRKKISKPVAIIDSCSESESESDAPFTRLTEKDFVNCKYKANIYFGSVEIDIDSNMNDRELGDKNEGLNLFFDTKNPIAVTLRWKDGIKVGKEIFSGFDVKNGVYMPLAGTDLADQGRFMKIVGDPVKIKKSIKTSNKSDIGLQQMKYLDF